MKRFWLLLLLSLLAAGCVRIQKQEIPADRAIYLKWFLLQKIKSDVYGPWKMMVMAERVDRYLKASEEERKAEAFKDLYGKVFSNASGDIVAQGVIQVRTNGKALTEEGARWEIGEHGADGRILIADCTGASTWNLAIRKEIPQPKEYSLTMTRSESGADNWTFMFFREETDQGKTAVFSSENLSGRWEGGPEPDSGFRGLAGEVLLDIHADGTRLDWAVATLRPDGTCDFESSRGNAD